MVLWHYSTIDIIALWNYSSIYIYGTMVLWYYHPNGSMRVYGSILNLVFLMLLIVIAKANLTGNCLRWKWNPIASSGGLREILGMNAHSPS